MYKPDEILSGQSLSGCNFIRLQFIRMKFYPGSVYPDEFYPFTGLSVYPVYPFYLFYPDEVYPEEGLSIRAIPVKNPPHIRIPPLLKADF